MIFHSKNQLRWLVYVSEIYRDDWSFIGKKSWRDDKFLALIHSVEFVDWDKVEELYSVYRVVFKWDGYLSDYGDMKFVFDHNKYPSNYVIKVEDVLYSYWDKEEFNFLSESRNDRRWVNPDKSVAKWFSGKKKEVEAVYDIYCKWKKE